MMNALFTHRILLWLYHIDLTSIFMRLFTLLRSLRFSLIHQRVGMTRWVVGLSLSVLAALTLLSAPAHGLMGWQQSRAVTLCTAQGMMTVWMSEADNQADHQFDDLKLKASQQCLACLTHVPNAAPPSQTYTLASLNAGYSVSNETNYTDASIIHWRWDNPRSPPILS